MLRRKICQDTRQCTKTADYQASCHDQMGKGSEQKCKASSCIVLKQNRGVKNSLPILVQEIKIKMSWKSLPVAARIVLCFILTLPPLVKHCFRRDKRGRVQPLEKGTGTASAGWSGRVPFQSPCEEPSKAGKQEPRRSPDRRTYSRD